MDRFRNGISNSVAGIARAAALCSALAFSLFAGAVQVVVSPSSQSIALGATAQFAAAVSGAIDTTVVWSVNGVPSGNSTVGTVDGTGLYTSPVAFPSPTTVNVTATSNADPTAAASASLKLHNPVPVLTSVTPPSFPVGAFNITVNGKLFLAGAKVIFGNNVLATQWVSSTQLIATGAATGAGSIAIFVSNGDPGPSISTPLYVQVGSSSPPPPGTIAVTVSPSNSAVQTGATKQFSATVTNTANTTVTWSVNAGSIGSTGLYTAPAAVPSPATVTVTATSAADPTKSGSTSVTITPPPPPITPTISFVNPVTIPVGAFTISVSGGGFSNTSLVSFGGTVLATTYLSPNQLTATGSATAAQAGQVPVMVANAGPTNSTAYNVTVSSGQTLSPQTASRFLQQAAFGPSPSSASHVQQVGLQPYLNEQFAMPQVSNYHVSGGGWVPNMSARFMTNTVNGPDQLRQRVAFALSQIFVVSLEKLNWTSEVIPFEEMLMADAFGNFQTLLTHVTLSPSMGVYLDMVNNDKANSVTQPNENYAREVMQLFSIGTTLLNPDGTPQVDAQNSPIPAYDQKNITELARALTGWTFAPTPGQITSGHNHYNTSAPMIAWDPNHDTGAKTLLNSFTLPAGQSAAQDLAAALQNIFQHPNVGPFFGKLMIQHLVTSNPSPAYVQRVAAAFNDNGQGVRGDLKAVISAILLDAEARQGDAGGSRIATGGHLQEPALFLGGVLRALNAYVDDTNYFSWDFFNMDQDLFRSPSVFNYYSPLNLLQGSGLLGPEFQIYTPNTAMYRSNLIANLFNSYSNNINSNGPGTTVDLTPYVNLASTPAVLVDALDNALTNGQMPSQMKQTIVTAVTGAAGNLRRAQIAIYLIVTSSYYEVWH